MNKLPKSHKAPFKEKDKYFEQLPYQIQDKVYTQQKKSFWNQYQSSIIWGLGLTTSIALIIGIFLFQSSPNLSSNELLAEVNENQIEEYFDLYSSEEDALEVIDIVLNSEYTPQEEEFMTFSDEEVNEYIETLNYDEYETIID